LAQEERKQREAAKAGAAASYAADEVRAVKAAEALLAQEQAEAQQKGQKVCALQQQVAVAQLCSCSLPPAEEATGREETKEAERTADCSACTAHAGCREGG
jgi:hypothetical protein